eukprot:5461304-Pyramimonas_sp.AAC.1
MGKAWDEILKKTITPTKGPRGGSGIHVVTVSLSSLLRTRSNTKHDPHRALDWLVSRFHEVQGLAGKLSAGPSAPRPSRASRAPRTSMTSRTALARLLRVLVRLERHGGPFK